MSIRFYANAPATTLSASVSNSALAITVASVTGYPIQFPYTLILDRGTASEEAVSVTAAAGTTLTVTRAIDSTTAFAHSIGAVVEHGITAQDIREPNAHINTGTAVHGLTGVVVGTTDIQALTNKDLSSGTNTFPTSLATLAGAQILTNKTLGTTNTINGFTASRFMEADGTGKLVSGTKVIPAGVVVGDTDTQTLTNKNLTSATNTFPTSLVTLTGIQTLTNKTLTDPAITIVTLVAEPVLRCTSATRPAHAAGRTIYETDTNKGYISDGTNWIRSFTAETATGSTGHTLTITPTADQSVTLPAGKWTIHAKVRFDYSTATARTYAADLFNGTAAVDSSSFSAGTNGAATLPLLAHVSIAATTTYTLRTSASVVDGTQFTSAAVLVAVPA